MTKNISKYILILLFAIMLSSCMTTSGKSETLIKPKDEKSTLISTKVKTTTDTKAEPIVIEKKQTEKPVEKKLTKSNESVNNVVVSDQNSNKTNPTKTVGEEKKTTKTIDNKKKEVIPKSDEAAKNEKEELQNTQNSSENLEEPQELPIGYRVARVALVLSIIIFGLLFLTIRIIMYLRKKNR